MKVGFTGTRDPATHEQVLAFQRVMDRLQPTTFIHGDCIGWDALAAYQVSCRFPTCTILKYPSNIKGTQAGAPGIEAAPPAPPLERNTYIVLVSQVLVACPKEFDEELRSGTWSTVRRARKQGRPVFLALPDGTLRFERVGGVLAERFGV